MHADPQQGIVTLGMGVALDLGGIAKGWAADRAADLLGMAGSCLVSMGGDIAVRSAERIIAGSLDAAKAGQLVEDAIKELDRKLH